MLFALLIRIHEDSYLLQRGDTYNPLVCIKAGYKCKIPLDLSIAEFTKNPFPNKYDKDEVKTLLSFAIHHRIYQMENSNIKQVHAWKIKYCYTTKLSSINVRLIRWGGC